MGFPSERVGTSCDVIKLKLSVNRKCSAFTSVCRSLLLLLPLSLPYSRLLLSDACLRIRHLRKSVALVGPYSCGVRQAACTNRSADASPSSNYRSLFPPVTLTNKPYHRSSFMWGGHIRVSYFKTGMVETALTWFIL